ncbi:MAG: biosynthetic-type acetolactate synthase large subunit [Erysipelotrichales bacterium]
MNNMVSGATALLKLLKYAGIDNVFGYPGGSLIPLYDAIYQQDEIKHYLVRHEQGAAHAAEAYGKVTNTIGCCIATSGPGASNLVTGITNAFMDSNPLLCITGQVNLDAIGKMSFQEVDIISIVRPITKKVAQLKNANDLGDVIFDLINEATSGRKGPVLLDVPKDVFMQQVDFNKVLSDYKNKELETKKESTKISKKDIDLFLKYLKEAKKPVLLLGAGIIKSDCEKEIIKIVNFFKIPVVTTLHGLGLCSSTPYYYGMAGMHGSLIANKALYNSDLVISLGSRFDDRLVGNNKKFVKYGRKIHIDIDEKELGKNLKTNLMIKADLKDFIYELNNHLLEIDVQSWILQLDLFKKEIESNYNKIKSELIHPYYVFKEINKNNKSKIYVSDVGQHQMWCAQYLKLDSGNQFVSSGGAGTMGYGLPAAIGTSVAYPNKQVIAILGDGGIQMTIQELIMLKQYNLNVKVIIFNNQRLGMVKQWQELFFEKRYSSTILDINPDFSHIAKAYNLDYIKIENKSEVKNISNIFESDGPLICEIMIDPDAKVLPMIPANQSFEEIIV